MNEAAMRRIFEIGETIAVEFKRCGNGIENDTYGLMQQMLCFGE